MAFNNYSNSVLWLRDKVIKIILRWNSNICCLCDFFSIAFLALSATLLECSE